MKQSLKFIIGFLFISITINNCQKKGSDTSHHNHRYVDVQPPRIDIEPVWINLGDHLGAVDLEMDSASVDVAEFSNNLKWIASGASSGYDLRVWEVETGNKLWEHRFTNQIEIVCFSPDDKYLLVGGKFNKLVIWNTKDWTVNREIDLKTSVETMKFSRNGYFLAVGLGNGELKLYDSKEYKMLHSAIHTDKIEAKKIPLKNRADVNSVHFSKGDKYVVSGGMDGKICIWELEGLKLFRCLPGHNASVKSVRVSPNGTCIASASVAQQGRPDNSIKIWDFDTGKLIHTLSFPSGMEAVEFTPNGKYLACGGREGMFQTEDEQGHIYFYAIPDDPNSQPIMQVHKEPVFRSEYLHFSKNGDKLVSSHEDGTVRLWNVVCN